VLAFADDHQYPLLSEHALAFDESDQRPSRADDVVPVQVERRPRRAVQLASSASGQLLAVALHPAVLFSNLEARRACRLRWRLTALGRHHPRWCGRERHRAGTPHDLDEAWLDRGDGWFELVAGFRADGSRFALALSEGAEGSLVKRTSNHGRKVADVPRHGRNGFS
jgi:hypothetical protein